jgi:uncharacterized protein YjbJ (UPF0337 family)
LPIQSVKRAESYVHEGAAQRAAGAVQESLGRARRKVGAVLTDLGKAISK